MINSNRLNDIEVELRKRISIALAAETFKQMSNGHSYSSFFGALCVTGIVDDPKPYMVGAFDLAIVTDEECDSSEFIRLINDLFDEFLAEDDQETHKLKTDPDLFKASFENKRKFEIRYNDRNFKVGDELILLETQFSGAQMKDGKPLIYTGRQIKSHVDYILSGQNTPYGLDDNWAVLSVTHLEHTNKN